MTLAFADYQLSQHADANLTRFVSQRGSSTNFVFGRYNHCRERYKERFDADMSYQEWEKLNYAIFMDDSEVASYIDIGTHAGTSLYAVYFQNHPMLVAYSDSTFAMMTVLPKNDPRLSAFLQRRYESSTLSDYALRHVEARQEVAAQFNAATGKPFEEALSKIAASEVVAPTPSPTIEEPEETNDDEPVTAMFARLDQTIQGHLDADGAATVEIEALEARLAALRTEAKLSDLSRRMLAGAQEMGGATFEQYQASMITDADARQTVALLLARVGTRSVAASAPVVEAKIEPITDTHPDRVPAMRTYRKSKNSTPKEAARKERDALILKRFEQGFVGREIAEEFGIAAQTCYTIKHRLKTQK